MLPQVSFAIRGNKPVAWLNNELKWRAVLAEEARKARAQIGYKEFPKTTHFQVEVIFYFNAPSVERVDLDNLAKPLLDTLFKLRRPQVKDSNLTGALFDVDDDRVFRLTLEKRTVSNSNDEGVDVTVSWR